MTARYAYLHGFGSSSSSFKGEALAKYFARRGLTLELPDLNRPSFERMTFSSILEGLDTFYDSDPKPLSLIGSSMGGYLAARWAQLRPECVAKLLLLCPAFDLPGRWERNEGSPFMQAWEARGALVIPDPEAPPRQLAWDFMADARNHPATPHSTVATRIIHGIRDETVPISSSRDYVQRHPTIQLVEVDDDHRLTHSLETIRHEAFAFFDVTRPG